MSQSNVETDKKNDAGDQESRKEKAIVLFSDGTGNSSAKLFKTNVWRMYEAVDLGPTRPGDRDQIAFYDNGVGTSAWRPLAMLGGIFGFGLKRNVLEIYRFLCRNYRPGDSIYAFGFSRGAFTIRLLAAFVASRGVVQYDTEAELVRRSVEEFRAFSSANYPNVFPGFVVLGRFLRTVYKGIGRGVAALPRLIGRLRKRASPRRNLPNHHPDIEFLGVWDTVAAYGGPIAEMTRGIDNWIWPLSPTDHYLHPKIRTARHALALDDERDSFHPLLWDEFKETLEADRMAQLEGKETDPARKAEYAALAKRFGTRLQQVWFAGMHADVGGGYPDESLSYVSLRWMMEQARAAKLRLLDSHFDRIKETANSFGPIHDSRSGLKSYYRYQPRKITAYMHPDSLPTDRQSRARSRIVTETLSLRDPTLGEQEYRPQGYLLSCQVHDSVIARITDGTDDYAPIALADGFTIVSSASPEVRSSEAALKRDNIEKRIRPPKHGDFSPFYNFQEAVWDLVYLRRLTYFFTIFASLLLALLPWLTEDPLGKQGVDYWPGLDFINRLVDDALVKPLRDLAPGILQPWVETLESRTWTVLGIIAAILVSMKIGLALDGRINDRMREVWCKAMEDQNPDRKAMTLLRRIRNSYFYQRFLRDVKWYILPNVVGFLLSLAILWAGAALFVQLMMPVTESEVCARSGQKLSPIGEGTRVALSVDQPCNATGSQVQRQRRYGIILSVPSGEPWRDSGVAATPEGLTASGLGFPAGYLGIPFRRELDARWLQPMVVVRGQVGASGRSTAHVEEISLQPLALKNTGRPPEDHYWGTFVAPDNGELFLSVNDAGHPIDMCYFYSGRRYGNSGRADVVLFDMQDEEVNREVLLRKRRDTPAPPPVAAPIAEARRCMAPAALAGER